MYPFSGMESMIRRMRGMSTPSSSISEAAGRGTFMMRERAVPNVTSSAKFTCPLARNSATSAPAVFTEGKMGKIGLRQGCIFSGSKSYIDRKSVVLGKSGDLGGRRFLKKKKKSDAGGGA